MAARRSVETIYLDHSATTRVDPRVVEAMVPHFLEDYGNPNSLHYLGQRAHQALESSRRTVAEILNCTPREIVFTGGGSESDNLALRGVALARQSDGRHVVTTPIEHSAVHQTLDQLRRTMGFEVTEVPVDELGMVDPAAVAAALRPDTVLVSVMYANNEVGSVQPIAEIGALLRARGIVFHSDAVQAGGYLPLDVQALNLDLMSLSAHKFHGPKGVGVLYIRRGTPYLPTLTGGGQEEGRRAGTQNIPYIVGLATALHLAQTERAAKNERLQAMRDHLIGGVLESVSGSRLTGHLDHRLPGHASFTIEGVEADALLLGLDLEGIAASSGSACKSGAAEPSHVLTAMGIPRQLAMGALRLTLGDDNQPAEVERALEVLPRVVEQLRAFAFT
ncbi:MAG TPA: cysteine desulfurase family protein [Ardenticatenaceae bacterium]|nr:cysteine desulfurase family protein [Ardenticatenaceae bacterium]